MNYLIGRSATSVCALLVGLLLGSNLSAQPSKPQEANAGTVPRVVSYSGKAVDAQGKPVEGTAGISLAIYKDQYQGAPLWMETQNVRADAEGNYKVQLGATKPDGLPQDLFSSGEARWLGVEVNGGAEQPRVLLMSVPYALAAADAQTLGGLPPSAFLHAAQAGAAAGAAASAQLSPSAVNAVTTAGGTPQMVAKFTSSSAVGNSQIFDNGSRVGIGNSAPAAKLDVSGGGIFRGSLSLPATGAATAGAGANSHTLNLTGSAFNSGTNAAVNENFRWQVEPVGNNTSNPRGKLNLLFGAGTASPSETGLSISDKGLITFASGQTFPGGGAGGGTVKSVNLSAPDTDFKVSGSPVTGSGTLKLDWLVSPSATTTPFAIARRDANGDIGVNAIFVQKFVQATEVDVTDGGLHVTKGGIGSVTYRQFSLYGGYLR